MSIDVEVKSCSIKMAMRAEDGAALLAITKAMNEEGIQHAEIDRDGDGFKVSIKLDGPEAIGQQDGLRRKLSLH
jgi:hypothetical protein